MKLFGKVTEFCPIYRTWCPVGFFSSFAISVCLMSCIHIILNGFWYLLIYQESLCTKIETAKYMYKHFFQSWKHLSGNLNMKMLIWNFWTINRFIKSNSWKKSPERNLTEFCIYRRKISMLWFKHLVIFLLVILVKNTFCINEIFISLV